MMGTSRGRREMVAGALAFCLAPVLGEAAEAGSGRPDFRPFWERWRKAVLEDDGPALLEMMADPLEAKGKLDRSEVRQVQGDQALTVLRLVLQENSGMSSRIRMTNKDLIRHMDPSEGRYPPVDPGLIRFRTADFVFSRRGGAWRLVRVYEGR